MNVIRKDATITNTDEEFPGAFEVVLSTPAKDRDGDELAIEDWKQPLPEHITFDVDHGMSVEKTIGSGVPEIKDGRLVVHGTYSSLPRAQEVRTLVKEGHVRTTSVAFATEKVTKDGKTRTQRELLNGAFVAIPSNTEAVVLSAKGAVTTKAKYDADQLKQMLEAGHALANESGDPSYPIGDTEDLRKAIHAVGRGSGDHAKIRAYIIRRADDLGERDLIPDSWNSDGSTKAAEGVETKGIDPNALVSINISASAGGFDINVSAWCVPGAESDAYADTAQRVLAAALEIASGGPDDDDNDEGTTDGDSAPAAPAKAAPVADTDAEALDLHYRALSLQWLNTQTG